MRELVRIYNNRRVPWICGNGNRAVPRGTAGRTVKSPTCIRSILDIKGIAGTEILYASAKRLERLLFRTWVRVTALRGYVICCGFTFLSVNKAAEKSQPTD